MKFIQGVAGWERLLLMLTLCRKSQREVVITTTKCHWGIISKYTVRNTQVIVLLFSSLMRLRWSTTSIVDIISKCLEETKRNDKYLQNMNVYFIIPLDVYAKQCCKQDNIVVLHKRKTKFNWVNLQKERLRQKQLMGTTGCLEIICSSVEVFKSMAK